MGKVEPDKTVKEESKLKKDEKENTPNNCALFLILKKDKLQIELQKQLVDRQEALRTEGKKYQELEITKKLNKIIIR